MQKLQTTLQRLNTNLPTQLEFLQVINRRGSSHFYEEKKLYKSLQAGDEGERKFIQYLAAFGMDHWVVVRNLWLKDFKTFECDLVLITKHCIYIFEVKNYRGTFTFKDGKCFFNEIETPLNPFEQVRSNTVSIRNYLKRLNINIPVKAVMIFTGEDNEVFIQSELKDMEVVQSNGIRNFIDRLTLEENKSTHHSLSPELLIKMFEQIETANPFLPKPISEPLLREIKGGIYCANCMSFTIKRSKSKIHCQCGLEESLDEALIRTVCEYSVLNFNRNFTRKELLYFLDHQVSLTFLKKNLNEHFKRIMNSSYTYYEIKHRLYEYIHKGFTIKEPRVFYHKNGEQSIFLSDSSFNKKFK